MEIARIVVETWKIATREAACINMIMIQSHIWMVELIFRSVTIATKHFNTN
jgi:hypothetical protein